MHRKNTRVMLDTTRPGGTGARNNVETFVAVLEPARHDVGPAFLIETSQPAERIAGEKLRHFLSVHLADLASPGLLFGLGCHRKKRSSAERKSRWSGTREMLSS